MAEQEKAVEAYHWAWLVQIAQAASEMAGLVPLAVNPDQERQMREIDEQTETEREDRKRREDVEH